MFKLNEGASEPDQDAVDPVERRRVLDGNHKQAPQHVEVVDRLPATTPLDDLLDLTGHEVDHVTIQQRLLDVQTEMKRDFEKRLAQTEAGMKADLQAALAPTAWISGFVSPVGLGKLAGFGS